VYQVADKEALVAALRERTETLESDKVAMESARAEARAAAARSEERVAAVSAEIRKDNDIIAQLQTEARGYKSKAKLKATVITQQEALLAEKQAAADKLARSLATAQVCVRAREKERPATECG
jgi:viroplasmin and RNaseH domain-containing protein